MASSTIVVPTSPIQILEPLQHENSSLEQFRKLFIGGLTYSITDEKLK
jgi:hypothetical protein